MKKELAFIFDLDGVIVDTAIYHYKAWCVLAGELGFEFTEEQNESLKGVSRMESLERLLNFGGITDISDERKIEMAAQKNALYRDYILQITPEAILPGVDIFIKECLNQGIKIALGSASKNAKTILEQIAYQDVFHAVIDGNKVTNSKPDPEVFLNAANELKVQPENCIIFEDAEAGIEAAKRAKMKSVGVGDKNILGEADMVIPGFVDVQVVDCIKLLN